MKKALSTVAASALMVVMFSSASFAISCTNGFQNMKDGTKISTPYCEDKQLARVARSYGYKVSNRQLRGDANLKDRICQAIGDDIRISQVCAGASLGGSEIDFPG